MIQPLNWVESLVDWLLRFGVNFRLFFDRGPPWAHLWVISGQIRSAPALRSGTSGVARFEGQD